MSQIDDGGSAFPVHANHVVVGDRVVAAHEPGMSLRDWFAGQALAGNLAYPGGDLSPESAAIMAYRYADAMLAARLTERK